MYGGLDQDSSNRDIPIYFPECIRPKGDLERKEEIAAIQQPSLCEDPREALGCSREWGLRAIGNIS